MSCEGVRWRHEQAELPYYFGPAGEILEIVAALTNTIYNFVQFNTNRLPSSLLLREDHNFMQDSVLTARLASDFFFSFYLNLHNLVSHDSFT